MIDRHFENFWKLVSRLDASLVFFLSISFLIRMTDFVAFAIPFRCRTCTEEPHMTRDGKALNLIRHFNIRVIGAYITVSNHRTDQA